MAVSGSTSFEAAGQPAEIEDVNAVNSAESNSKTVNHLREWENQHEEELSAQREREAKLKVEIRKTAVADIAAWKAKRDKDLLAKVEKHREEQKTMCVAAECGSVDGVWEAVWEMIDGNNTGGGVQKKTTTTVMRDGQPQRDSALLKNLLLSLKKEEIQKKAKVQKDLSVFDE
eukprot:CAMPEP_0113846696 /NCGR_PEP_ID=MMETSP0372-20130328/1453_1 /TAXON_ID=340204 /ORGANISM="Lankesteria abbotti" /LENGTH=172 /DNA_ID=CAMNT_0000815873 /DNA_START=58 /DNA_END=576 /DNA_ORIENTATION=+ /assembly_acc=CAM_ASM_000359